MKFGNYDYDEFIGKIISFHGSIAPGIVLGGFMLEKAYENLPKDGFYDVICETKTCLPDSVQILTPCSIGNGWIKIYDYGKFSMVVYDKYSGEGVRVFIDHVQLKKWPVVYEWFFKLKKKSEQDINLLLEGIKSAGGEIIAIEKVKVNNIKKKQKGGKIAICHICSEPYPVLHGKICRACFNVADYNKSYEIVINTDLNLVKTNVEESVGYHLICDVTKIIPGKKKYTAFKRGQIIRNEDLQILKSMGKEHVYLEEKNENIKDFVHENIAASELANAMVGENVIVSQKVSEGRADVFADIDGILQVDEDILDLFNNQESVVCAAIKNYSIVKKEQRIAGTRSIPLFIHKNNFLKALNAINRPIFSVYPFVKKKIGLIVTGNEVYEKRIDDAFTDVINEKLEKYDLKICKHIVLPDDKDMISSTIKDFVNSDIEVIITTAGMSVDPDDVTKFGIIDSGANVIKYGMPVLPGSMLLLADLNEAKIIGFPACGIYNKVSSFDLILPRILADIDITNDDIAKLGRNGIVE